MRLMMSCAVKIPEARIHAQTRICLLERSRNARGRAKIQLINGSIIGKYSPYQRLPEIAKTDKKILFVGTKKQMKEIVKAAAESVEMPYVTVRWVGGTLTNVETVNRQIKKLKDLERRMASGELENRYSKLEVQRFQEEIDLLNERYGGIKNMSEQPAAIVVVDANEDKNAIKEANTLKIPVFAITDTNVDPTNIDYVIPCNDDAIKATQLILDYMVAAIKEGRK